MSQEVASAPPVCGFVGLGSQGASIARRMIDAGLPARIWARRPETLEPFYGAAARLAGGLGAPGALASGLLIFRLGAYPDWTPRSAQLSAEPG